MLPDTANDALIPTDASPRGSPRTQRPQTPPDTLQTNPKSTPVLKVSGSTPYSTTRIERNDGFNALATESNGMFIGPMPPDEFLEKFLNVPSGGFRSSSIVFSGPPRAKKSGEVGQSQESGARPIKSELDISASIVCIPFARRQRTDSLAMADIG